MLHKPVIYLAGPLAKKCDWIEGCAEPPEIPYSRETSGAGKVARERKSASGRTRAAHDWHEADVAGRVDARFHVKS
jgi:hypothetical protein